MAGRIKYHLQIGETYNFWTIIGENPLVNKRRKRWLCRCVCGIERPVLQIHLVSGASKSCGCQSSGKTIERHGQSSSLTYQSWLSMRNRCFNVAHPRFPDYGGRGITVCDRWKNSFEKFLADMGERPSKLHTLDRINGGQAYEPENCRWATKEIQISNRGNHSLMNLKLNGQVKTVKEWSEDFGIPLAIVSRRIRKYKWLPYRALSTPIRRKNSA